MSTDDDKRRTPMTIAQVKSVAGEYADAVLKDFKASKAPDDPRQSPTWEMGIVQVGHAKWMCDQIRLMEDRDKAMRWLCFVQGVLWMSGLRTIDEMRDDNR